MKIGGNLVSNREVQCLKEITPNQEEISFLLITFNRSHLLAKTLRSLREAVIEAELKNARFIVADDASSIDHQKIIDSLEFDAKVMANINSGLGANQNRGLAYCNSEYIFQIQDDWIYTGEASFLKEAIEILKSDADIGIVQLTPVNSDVSFEVRSTSTGCLYKVFKPDRAPWHRHCSLRPYSDNPHVKSRNFIKDIGAYLEGVRMSVTENDYKFRVANQNKWLVAQIMKSDLFKHIGFDESMNIPVKKNYVLSFINKLPMGKKIENLIRNAWKLIDHILARMTSVIFNIF